MRRGLTMVELLVSLALLGSLMVAVSAWVAAATGAVVASAGPLRWQAAADRVHRRIHEDLLIGDETSGETRVRVVNGELEIRTRATGFGEPLGPVAHVYRLHRGAQRGLFKVEERSADGKRVRRRLLEGVAEFRCEIDEDGRTLSVTIEPAGGEARKWRFDLP